MHGLGLSGGAWWRTVDALAPSMRVITFDHRGIGRSESWTYAYTTEAMADDAVSILDELAIERVHLYGFSLGGMVAQQIALRHPEPGPLARPGRDAFRRAPGDGSRARSDGVLPAAREDAVRGGGVGVGPLQLRPAHAGPSRSTGSPRTSSDACANPFNERAYRAQLLAASLHNCYGRLERIRAPTLVVHGARDRIIPVANARMTAERVPGARMKILADAGHLYPTEEPAVDEAIGEFFAAPWLEPCGRHV